MQTFLPFPSFTRSARVLDQQRLGKQRVECLQVLNVFAGVRQGWGNHPITRMWTGHELSLLKYGLIVCRVWRDEQGHADTCYDKMRLLFPSATMGEINNAEPPPWFGDDLFHRSHQANLLDKAKQHYLHHSDKPHRPHGSGTRRCDGLSPHKPHGGCNPRALWTRYRTAFPGVPVGPGTADPIIPYVWPV